MTLLEFLNARLDEDEQTARAATRGKWQADVDEPRERTWMIIAYDEAVEESSVVCEGDREGGGVYHEEDAAHIARHDPARVLAEIAAKRAVINMVPLSQEEAEERFAGFFVEEGAGWEKAQEYVLKHLAAVYANHPDYQQEWADE